MFNTNCRNVYSFYLSKNFFEIQIYFGQYRGEGEVSGMLDCESVYRSRIMSRRGMSTEQSSANIANQDPALDTLSPQTPNTPGMILSLV